MLRAILLGWSRESMSLIDRPEGQPIRSLAYFETVLAEVPEEPIPSSSWWQHLERCERHSRAETPTQPGRAQPDLEQAAARTEPTLTAACSESTKGETSR